MHELCADGKEIIDFDGKFTRNENGDIVFNFSKDNKGKRVIDEPGFVSWMLRADFITYDTKEKARRILIGELS